MANTNLGQINKTGDDLALFQKIFTGEVLAAYEQATLLDNLTVNKTISNGKSASFKNTGKLTSGEHTKGTIVSGNGDFEIAETIINVEPRIYVAEQVSEIDDLMNDFDAASIINKEIGTELANAKDKIKFKEIIKSARSANKITSLPGGSSVVNADLASTNLTLKGEALVKSIFSAKLILEQKNVTGESYVVLRPQEYYVLAQNKDIISADFTNNNGGLDTGKVLMVAGIKVYKSNNLPNTNTVATDTRHGVDASKVYGVVFTKEAIATVNLLGINTKIEDIVGGYGKLLSGSVISGTGVLRPECAVELVSE